MKSTPTYQKYALRLLRFYPGAWRERYADEASAVLEEQPATLRTLFDLTLGMLDAHLHLDLFTERKIMMLQRLRNSQLTIFSLFIPAMLFWLAYNILHNNIFYYANYAPALLQANYSRVLDKIVNVAGLCALITTLIGGAALIRVALQQAVANKREGFSRLFARWRLSVLAFVAIVVLFFLATRIRRITDLPFIKWLLIGNQFFYIIAFIVLALMAWIVLIGPFCLLLGTRRAELSPQLLGTTFVPALLTTLAISVMALLMLVLAIGFSIGMAEFGILKRIIFFDLDTAFMLLLAMFAFVSLWRGYNARRKLALA